MGNFLKRLFGAGPEPVAGVTPEELKQELTDLKKIMRKQTMAMEMHKEEILDRMSTLAPKDLSLEALQEMADSFFHLEAAIRESCQLSEGLRHSFAISWKKIEQLLKGCDMEQVREAGVPFDPRLHEAVSTINGGDGTLQVLRILQPGYLSRGKVVRPAKVALG